MGEREWGGYDPLADLEQTTSTKLTYAEDTGATHLIHWWCSFSGPRFARVMPGQTAEQILTKKRVHPNEVVTIYALEGGSRRKLTAQEVRTEWPRLIVGHSHESRYEYALRKETA
jgi:hypothetical protein